MRKPVLSVLLPLLLAAPAVLAQEYDDGSHGRGMGMAMGMELGMNMDAETSYCQNPSSCAAAQARAQAKAQACAEGAVGKRARMDCPGMRGARVHEMDDHGQKGMSRGRMGGMGDMQRGRDGRGDQRSRGRGE